jgi:hypothetical protein
MTPDRPVRAQSKIFAAGDAVGAAIDERPLPAMAAAIVGGDETVILCLRPSPLYVVLGAIHSILFIVILTMLLAYLANTFPSIVRWNDEQAFGLGVGLLLIRLAWQGVDWWGRIYVLTDRRVIRRAGVLRVSVFETALRNVQHTSVFVGVRERAFGLGTIGFATAGSDTYEAFWAMIARPFVVHKIILDALDRYGNGRH